MLHHTWSRAGAALLTALAVLSSHSGAIGQEDLSTIRGELTVHHVDDFENGVCENRHFIKDAKTGKSYRLRFEKKAPGRLVTGAKVEVRGRHRGEDFVLPQDGSFVTTVESAPTTAAALTGQKNVLVILVDFLDSAVTCTPDSVHSMMFGPTQSVDGMFRESSFGAFSLTGAVAGPYRLNYYASGSCDYMGWASAADAAAQAAGFNLGSYTNRIYVLPGNVSCGWGGLGTVGGNPGKAWVASCAKAQVYAHELGHNFLMQHSSTDSDNNGVSDCEYCDVSDVMGYAGGGLRQVNAPHKDQMGWLPAGKVLNPAASGVYQIAPLTTSPQGTPYPHALKIGKPGTSTSYYFSYRLPVGYDATLDSRYANAVNVHHYSSGSAPTYHIQTLADGTSFYDAANGITVTQLSRTSDYATVQVTLPSLQQRPAISISPASLTGAPGATLSYTLTVTNRDGAGASASTFSLAAGVPSGWSASFSAASLTLSPGQSGTATVFVSSPTSAATGSYQFTVTASDPAYAIHTASTSAGYDVAHQTLTAPTALVASVKRGIVSLKWSYPGDTTLVASYEVLRNGVVIGSSTTTAFSDKPGSGTFSYTVRARGKSGELSAQSAPVSVTLGGNKGNGSKRWK